MNKIIIACVLAALMMTGGTLYAGENSDGTAETSAAVTRAGRGYAKRAAQKGEQEKGRRGKSAGAGTARAEGRRQAAANLKAMDKTEMETSANPRPPAKSPDISTKLTATATAPFL